jgi:CheY-like chemotaxis protein
MQQDNERSPGAPESPATILVVEDDPVSRKLIQSMLADAGYEIRSMADGQQCLEKVGEVRPDLILLDVVMPNMDGIQTCRRLKRDGATRHVPVIFVTSRTDDGTLRSAFDAGASDYVRKPVSRVELLARVHSALTQCRAIKKLKEEERLKGVLETAGGVCHELNQPLQYILGAVQVLMMDVSPQDTAYGQLDAIRARVEHMGEITRKLADITCLRTRKYAGDKDIIDIGQSISNSAREEEPPGA